jgi:hypothetical protein
MEIPRRSCFLSNPFFSGLIVPDGKMDEERQEKYSKPLVLSFQNLSTSEKEKYTFLSVHHEVKQVTGNEIVLYELVLEQLSIHSSNDSVDTSW